MIIITKDFYQIRIFAQINFTNVIVVYVYYRQIWTKSRLDFLQITVTTI